MTDNKKQGFNTKAVHAGYHVSSGPVNPPIIQSSTASFESCQDGADRFASRDKRGIYTRLSNPTVEALEEKIAVLENGFGGIATASGMAAVSAIYFTYLKHGDHIIATSSMYGPSRTILESDNFFKKFGIESTFLDTSDHEAVENAFKPNTKLLYIETPANPTLSITNILKMVEIAHKRGIQVVVDNTFCSPYLQNPLELGADVVIYSMTKSIGGHAAAVGGMIVPKTEENYYKIRPVVVNLGGTLPPDTAILFFNGVKTLGLRMEKMQENASRLADYLNNHPKIDWVIYPGLEKHPMYDLVKSGIQMRGPGSMISFGVKGGLENAKKFMDADGEEKVEDLAVSLGGVESLIESPALMTHAGVSKQEREKAGIYDELVRFSAGIEDYKDIEKSFDMRFSKI